MALKREATITAFKAKEGDKEAFRGEIEVHEDIPKGVKLSFRLYNEVSTRGTQYHKGMVYYYVPKEAPAQEPTE